MGFQDDLDPEEKELLAAHLVHSTAGPKFSPLPCTEDCPLRRDCPFIKMGRKPTNGAPCPWEQLYADRRFRTLCEQFEVKDLASVDAAILREYVNWEVMEARYHGEYSENPRAVERVFKGVDHMNEPIYDVKPNPIIKNLYKTSERKAKLLQSMVGTRMDKAKHAEVGERKDPAMLAAEYMRKLYQIQQQEKEKAKLLTQRQGDLEEIEDAEFEVRED